jgi:RNA polymerase sigma-70 factor (ECF subfamily)
VSPDEFSRQYAEHVVPITRFVARRVERADVEDIVADVLSVAWHKHSISNHRRKLARQTGLIARLVVRDSAPSAESIAIADISLATAWARLPQQYREVLSLVAIDGLTVTEAAGVLGITANAVSIRLNRARNQLSRLLAGDE